MLIPTYTYTYIYLYISYTYTRIRAREEIGRAGAMAWLFLSIFLLLNVSEVIIKKYSRGKENDHKMWRVQLRGRWIVWKRYVWGLRGFTRPMGRWEETRWLHRRFSNHWRYTLWIHRTPQWILTMNNVGVCKWLKQTVCKTVPFGFVGSNPTLYTSLVNTYLDSVLTESTAIW